MTDRFVEGGQFLAEFVELGLGLGISQFKLMALGKVVVSRSGKVIDLGRLRFEVGDLMTEHNVAFFCWNASLSA